MTNRDFKGEFDELSSFHWNNGLLLYRFCAGFESKFMHEVYFFKKWPFEGPFVVR